MTILCSLLSEIQQGEPSPPHTHMQLGFHVHLKQLEQGLSPKFLPIHGIFSSSWGALSGLSGRGCALIAGVGRYMGVHPFREEGERGGLWEEVREEAVSEIQCE